MTKKRRWIIIIGSVLALIIIGLVAARMYLPTWLTEYVNKQLNSIKGYEGSVEEIDVHLYRGAYSIHKLEVRKTKSGIPVPFVSIETMDLSIEWKSLFHGRIVSEIEADKPVVNFATSDRGKQTGKGVDWTEEIKKLMPIDINHVRINNGRLAYRNFSTSPQVNLHIHNIDAEVTNLRNVVDEKEKLPSNISVRGKSIGGGDFGLKGKMNIVKKVPDMKIATQLENVNLPALNEYFKAFAGLDVEKGEFDVYSEITVDDGKIGGYVKPIARHIELIDLRKDANPIKLIWESIASVVIEIFSNQSRDQFATQVPLSGNINNIKSNSWVAIVGILKNAFVQALNKGFERGLEIKPLHLEKQ